MSSSIDVQSPRRVALLAITLLITTAVAYSPLLQCGYIWDDNDYVTENRTLRNAQGLSDIWLRPSMTPQYYPLVHSTFWLEYHIWGLHPTGFHLTNLALHSLNAMLLWYLLFRLQIPGAWLAAILFAVHPVEVESVAWITERKNVLSGSFYLLALISFWNYWLSKQPEPLAGDEPAAKASLSPVQWLVISHLCFVAALLSKTVTATLPAVILVLIWWKTGRLSVRESLRLIPMFAIGITMGLTTVWLEKHQVGASGVDWQFTIWQRFLIAGQAIWFYAAKLAWPTNLAFIYPRWDIADAPAWHYLFPVSMALLLIGLWAARKRIGRGTAAAWFIFAGTLFPALGFFDVYPMRFSFVADHFQYLASIALITLFAAGVARLAKKGLTDTQWVPGAALACGLGTLTALTWNQVQIYRDVETLWYDTLVKNPDCFLAHNNLGAILNRRGEFAEAQRHLKEALRVKPDFIDALVNMGKAREGLQDVSGATDYYQRALDLNPNYAPAANGLGAMLGARGDMEGAEKLFRQALTSLPNYPPAVLNLAAVFENEGDMASAIKLLQQGLEADPDAQSIAAKLITTYLQNDRLPEAKQLILKQLETAPSNTELIGGLGIIALREDLPAEAIKQFQRVLDIDPKETNAIYGMVMAHRAAGDEAKAAKYEAMLQELQPQQAN